ncbi:uncharacterized protein LOC135133829 [Zophobas morio]|uniref:uncharacterized protein LOC135133829 n=1 Tax=Zophobas morio TaxID=2755281 RepID=UPI003082CF29
MFAQIPLPGRTEATIQTLEGKFAPSVCELVDNFSALANKIPSFPRRVSACGYLTALEVLVDSNPSDYFGTQIAAIGHRVLIHNSYYFSDWSAQNMLTEKGIMNLIGITPSVTYSTPTLLWVYPVLLLPPYHETGTYPKTRICNLRDIHCLTEHRPLIMNSVPGFDFSTISPNHEWGTEQHVCKMCLPDCDYVDYSAESSSGIFTRKYSSNQLNLFGGVVIQHQSVVRVYFNDLVATKNRRDVVFSWHTLLAFYGGLLGLFIGFSFVSAVELVYFFTIRLLLDIKHKNEAAQTKKATHLVNVKPHQEEILNPRHLMTYHRDKFNLRRRSNSNS